MRRRLLGSILSLVALVGLTQPHSAYAAAGQHGAGIGIGQVFLLGDFAESFSNSVGFDAMYSYEASDIFGLLTHITYSSHSNGDDTNTLRLIGVSPDLRISLAYIDKLVLYAFTGFGLFSANQKLGNSSGSVITFSFNAGGGFGLALGPHFQFGTQLGLWSIFNKNAKTTSDGGGVGTMEIGGTTLNLLVTGTYLF
jgi:hypothetical protein